MFDLKLFATFMIGYLAFFAALIGVAGFFLGPLWGHPKAKKRAVICILIAVVLFFVFWLLSRTLF